ncbi:hypothetical protein LQ564_09630 [Massilia sp. G4R7]|uniref:Uncharacterized protein n=1 Tax=Massilia phyllostachyos TaxID=2898585 RepID=A0ABS8Q4A0_9BURK|nr:hypothetical protein [Massilia phyllostachyos]MCD2516569.1 hypothetical protein [Massilia phyllostachyos]
MPRFAFLRPAPLARIAVLLLCAAFALLCLARARLIGDGMEYLAMAQGFVVHGSPDLRRADVAALQAMPPKALARGGLEPRMLDDAIGRIERDGVIVHGFARAVDGGIHAVHFWMYSLLAAPFYALVAALGQNPFMAPVLLNLAIAACGAWCIRRWFPRAGLPELGLFALMGPLYYTVWIGPEVMAGCCVLLAVLAALRRDLPLCVALAGLGATQNPSIAGLIPAAGAYALLYRWAPALVPFPDLAAASGRLRGAALSVGGLLLAVLPYVHNQAVFGMPSIISHYYTDVGLIRPERLFSFLFDLNQGLLIGFPALLSCIALVVLAGRRRTWLPHLAIALLLALGMALPTLAAANWSSGAIVVARYAYWTSMPVLAVCLAAMTQWEARRRWLALGLALLLQAAATWNAFPSRRAPTLHTHAATWVLGHAPHLYNPDPEIFLERERRREDPVTPDQVVVHRGPAGPTKLMRFWSNGGDDGGLCASGAHLEADHVKTLASGWRYYSGPLRCAPGASPFLHIAITPDTASMLLEGWPASTGPVVWNTGRHAALRIEVPPGRRPALLGLRGYYHHPVRRSRVSINGVDLGVVALGQAPLVLPASLQDARVLEIRFEHTREPRPAVPGEPPLGFFLHGVDIELAD